ncbi:MAG: hypothetical protein U9Q81_19260 [Pseudomonadota bacterium]|nr:hypothetical protein [Pseudomonadota bacterium]
MDLSSAAEILTFSRPLLDALLAGSKDKLKEVGKGLTAKTLDALHGFWQRLTQVRPEAGDLARRSAAEPAAAEDLKRLIAEALDADPTLKRLAAELRPAIQVGYQSGGITQIAGEGSVQVAGDVTGDITLNNKGD